MKWNLVVELSCCFIDRCPPPPVYGRDTENNKNLIPCLVLAWLSVLLQEGLVQGKRWRFEKTQGELERWVYVHAWSGEFLRVNFLGGVSRQIETRCVCCVVTRYGLRAPILIFKTRPLGIHLLPHSTCFRDFYTKRVSRSSSHFIRRRRFISNFKRRGFSLDSGSALWIWNGREYLSMV